MAGALVAVGIAAWLLLLIFFRSHRNWLPFYVVGSVGLAFVIIGVARSLIPLEVVLKILTAQSVHQIANLAHVETRVFPGVPGALMVLVVPQNQGWTVLNIGIESSGLLEIAALTGMVGFYPGWSLRRRLGAVALGITATCTANVVRVSFIAASLHWGGKDLLFISHTLLGRAIFFVMVVAIFWFVLSLPTLRTIYHKIQEERAR